MNFRYKLNPRKQPVSKIDLPRNKLPEIAIGPASFQLKNSSFIFSRLNETPTFHLMKTRVDDPANDGKKKNKDLKVLELLRFCNTEKLDLAIDSQKQIQIPKRALLSSENANKRMLKLEKYLLYFGGRDKIRINKSPLKRKEKLKTHASIIYEQFFHRPNLNQMVNLSDLVKKKRFFADNLSKHRSKHHNSNV